MDRGRGIFGPRVRLAVLAGGIATAIILLAVSGSFSVTTVRDQVRGAGIAAPVVFVLVSTVLTAMFFPGPLLAGAAGLLFGTAAGWPIAVLSATTGALFAASISRWWAHDAAAELAGPRIGRLRAWVGDRGFVAVLLLRVAPGMPYNLVNYGAGLTAVPMATFALATAIGTAPRTLAYVAFGGSFGDFSSPETLAAVGLLVLMGLIGVILLQRDPTGPMSPGFWTVEGPKAPASPPEPDAGD